MLKIKTIATLAFLPLMLLGRQTAMSETIPPQVAGGFYPANPEELRAMIAGFLDQASSEPVRGEITGVLVPHAGYVYSGKTAAQAYRQLKGRAYSTVIIIAPSHRFPVQGAATISAQAMATPFGEVPIDLETIKELQKLTPLVTNVPQAFQGEHAVEVQLPFLQTVLKKFKIVPLLMSQEDLNAAGQIGEALAKIIKRGKTLLLISTDLSHYPDKITARTVDTTTLKALRLAWNDPEYFWRASRLIMMRAGTIGEPRQGRAKSDLVCTYCGEAGVLAALYAMKDLGAKGRLLDYTNSGETEFGEADRAVGYAAYLWLRGIPEPERPALTGEQRKKLLSLARAALVNRLTKNMEPRVGIHDDPDFNLPAAVFVTLRKKGIPQKMSLRGCIGSLVPDLPLWEAVQFYAVKSALEDRRFPPVQAEELDSLSIEISRLTPFKKIKSHSEIKHGQGVIVRQGLNTGLFLPQVWESFSSKEEFLGELCQQKAYLSRNCWTDPKTEIQVFDAEAFEEPQ
ncbi:MAG: AmmeMemoRadiSam system protein B [Elusimicrobia bacterium]|nr:AmmeMemoRadiSam system protein B [Elusimicrobiota bacterium]